MDSKTFTNKLSTASKIAICVSSIEDQDTLNAITFLAKYLKQKETDYNVLIAKKLPQQITDKLKKDEINFATETKPVSYVVSVDYSDTPVDKVTWDIDKEEGKLKFYIVPTEGEFDFDNIEYDTEGNNFDLTLTLGLDDFKDMDKIYSSSDYLFNELPVIALSDNTELEAGTLIPLNSEDTLTVKTFNLLKSDLSEENTIEFLSTVIGMSGLNEDGGNASLWQMFSELANDGVDVNKAIRKTYYSKSYANLDLQIKLMHNVSVDKDARVIWSTVSSNDLKFCKVTSETLDLKGRIPFNTSEDFDLAIAAYEINTDEVHVVVESNDKSKYSASNIAGVFDGEGSDVHAEFDIKDISLKDFGKRFFDVLNEMYSLNIKGKGVDFKGSVDTPDVSKE